MWSGGGGRGAPFGRKMSPKFFCAEKKVQLRIFRDVFERFSKARFLQAFKEALWQWENAFFGQVCHFSG